MSQHSPLATRHSPYQLRPFQQAAQAVVVDSIDGISCRYIKLTDQNTTTCFDYIATYHIILFYDTRRNPFVRDSTHDTNPS